MAQRTTVILEDDIDGGEADETVTFGLDGQTYEIDLNTKNAEAMREALSAYVASARRAGKATAAPKRQKPSQSRTAEEEHSPSAIREWAKAEGIAVNERGRLNKEVIEKYEYAHGLDKK